MKVVKPIPVTETEFVSSTIPEPDPSAGEIEFVPDRFDGYTMDRKSSPLDTYTIDAAVGGGYIYVLEGFGRNEPLAGQGYVHRYNLDGTYSGFSFLIPNGISSIEVNGNIFLGSYTGYVREYSSAGAQVALHDITATVSNASAICSSGGVYYVLDHSTGEIFGFDSSFTASGYKIKIGEPELQVYGLTYNDGLIYYTDQSSRQIFGITLDNSEVSKTIITQSNSEYSYFAGVFFNSSGDLYSLNQKGGQFYRYVDGVYAGNYEPEDRVVRSTLHKVYQCAVSTLDVPEDGVKKVPPTWVEVGATNRWAMFDYKRTTKSKDGSSVAVSMKFTGLISSVNVLDMVGVSTVKIVGTSASSGEIYNQTFNTGDFIDLVVTDIPPFDDLTIDVEITGADLEVGEVVCGHVRELGRVVSGVVSDRIDYSRLVYDEFGEVEYVERPVVKYTTYPVVIPKAEALGIERYLDTLKGQQAVWVGDTGGGDLITTFGRIERSPMTYNNQSIVEYQIKVRGSI